MKKIEFEAIAKNGVIKIPEIYKDLDNSYVKITIRPFNKKDVRHKKSDMKKLLDQIVEKNIFSNITKPEKWQRDLRNEWEKGITRQ